MKGLLTVSRKLTEDRKTIVFVLLTLFVFSVDQLSKLSVLAFKDSLPFEVIPNVFRILHSENTGVAFGFFQGNNSLFIIVSIVIAAAIIFYFNSFKSGIERLTASLVLAGNFGNLFDRIFRGGVIDFIAFFDFPVFNVADAVLTVSAVLIAWIFLKPFLEKRWSKNDKVKGES